MITSRFVIGGGLFLAVYLIYTYISPMLLYLTACLLTGWEFWNLCKHHTHHNTGTLEILALFALHGIVSSGIVLHDYSDDALRLVLFVAVSDVVQYLTGSVLGRTKIGSWPSPNKTIEGYLSVAGMLIAAYYIPGIGLRKGFWWLLGGVFGDLYVSACKRSLDIKDSGTLLGSHGGWFDRVDSIYGATIMYLLFVV